MSTFDDDSIEENVPTMRSVAMMAPPMPLARVPMRSGLAKMPLAGPISDKPKAPPPPPPSSWKVLKALELPSWHPLSRSHTLVQAECGEISLRIADFLCQKSIAAEFDNEQAVARAETGCSTKFCIRLWSNPNGVIVEVQRSSGCGFVFQQVVKGIFGAAKGSSTPSLSARPLPRSLPAIPPSEHEENLLSGVQFACDSLLAGARMDVCLLAVQSLVNITKNSNPRIAKKVLEPPLLLKLVGFITNETVGADALERDYHINMHRCAVMVLANCLEAIAAEDLHAVLASVAGQTAILEGLLTDVREAYSKPHEAAAACRCLKVFRNVLDLPPALSDYVVQASNCRHAMLREQCTQLLKEL